MTERTLSRREALLAGCALASGAWPAAAGTESMLARPIPSSGEMLPVIGLGTYNVFDVDGSTEEIADRKRIIDLLTGAGGRLIDTSPMYDRSERIIGEVISAGAARSELFIATKVWTDGREAGLAQMRRSAELMGSDAIDLMQVHNLRDTAVHMRSIRELQEAGAIRYSGLTHYRASALDGLESAMREHRPDFIQINYSLGEREAEQRVLPLARDMGIAVLINRPFQAGALFAAVAGMTLPEWSRPFAASWGQFFLKFIVGHPAVSCVIPATSKPKHMADNVEAGFAPLPDPATRQRMADFIAGV